MSATIAPRSKAAFLTTMTNFREIQVNLFKIARIHTEEAARATELARIIAENISACRVPMQSQLEDVALFSRVSDTHFEDLIGRLDFPYSNVINACDMLFGIALREPNGDTVKPEDASAEAISEAIY